jgi:hypothetical protein
MPTIPLCTLVAPASGASWCFPLRARVVANAAERSGSSWDSSSGGGSRLVTPWELMGRVVQEGTLRIDDTLQHAMVRSAAAQAVSMDFEEFEGRLEVSFLSCYVCALQPLAPPSSVRKETLLHPLPCSAFWSSCHF